MTRTHWKNIALFTTLAMLSGCSARLYSHSWMSQAQCDRMGEMEARANPDCAKYEYTESLEGK